MMPNYQLTIMSLLVASAACTGSPQAGGGNIGSPQAASANSDENANDNSGDADAESKVINRQVAADSPKNSTSLQDLPAPSAATIKQLVSADAAKHAGGATIYATIGHLVAAGKGTHELQDVRFGMTKALNSVSSNAQIVRLAALDPAQTVYRINLGDFGLSAASLNTIKTAPDAAQNLTSTDGATVVKGDWLVFALTRPEVYDRLMHLPPTIDFLEGSLGVDKGKAVYLNVTNSEVTFANRVLMRVPIEKGGKPGGYYWRSFDFARPDTAGRAFQNPAAMNSASISDLVAGEFFFSLPNGLQGYMLSGFGRQQRFDALNYVATDGRRTQDGLHHCVGGAQNCGFVINGESCLSCHTTGIKMPRNAVGATGASVDDVKKLMVQDQARFATAIKEMGFDDVNLEPVAATIDRYKANRKTNDVRKQGGEVSAVF